MKVYEYVVNVGRSANQTAMRLLMDGYPEDAFELRRFVILSINAYQEHDYITSIAIASILEYRSNHYFGGNLKTV